MLIVAHGRNTLLNDYPYVSDGTTVNSNKTILFLSSPFTPPAVPKPARVNTSPRPKALASFRHTLDEMPNHVVRLMVAMIRLAQGFPQDLLDVCRSRDIGDALRGKKSRTQKGPNSSAVMHDIRGIGNAEVGDTKCDPRIGSAGRVRTAPPE